jgi:hypothetical protein
MALFAAGGVGRILTRVNGGISFLAAAKSAIAKCTFRQRLRIFGGVFECRGGASFRIQIEISPATDGSGMDFG